MAQQVEEEGAVGQAGQPVVPCVVGHPLHQGAVARDVAHQARGADGGALLVPPRGATDQDPAPVAVGVAHAVLVLERVGAAFEVRGQRGAQRRGVFRVDAVEPVGRGPARHGGQPEQIAPARREIEAISGQVPVPEHVGSARKGERELFLPVADLVVLLHHRGLVAKHGRDAKDRPVLALAREKDPVTGQRASVARRARQRARHRFAPGQPAGPLLGHFGRAHGHQDVEDLLRGQILLCDSGQLRRRRVRRAHDQRGRQLEHGEAALFEESPQSLLRPRRLRPALLPVLHAAAGARLGAVQQRGQRGDRLLQLGALRVVLAICGVDRGDQLTELRRQIGPERCQLATKAGMHRQLLTTGAGLPSRNPCTKSAP